MVLGKPGPGGVSDGAGAPGAKGFAGAGFMPPPGGENGVPGPAGFGPGPKEEFGFGLLGVAPNGLLGVWPNAGLPPGALVAWNGPGVAPVGVLGKLGRGAAGLYAAGDPGVGLYVVLEP
jgi:hypothetical protein